MKNFRVVEVSFKQKFCLLVHFNAQEVFFLVFEILFSLLN
jgi:hypothetical protein